MNQVRSDFEIVNHRGTVAIVEVKNVPSLSLSLATELRRGLSEDLATDSSPVYVLIISQEKAFLWEPEQFPFEDAEPVAIFPMRPILRDYLSDAVLDQHLRGAELEIAIQQWLNDMTRGSVVLPDGLVSVVQFAERVSGGEVRGGEHL